MIWQDIVIFACVCALTATIIPLIIHKVSMPLLTVIPMTAAMAVLAMTYATLGLWLSFSIEVISFGLWSIVLRNSYRPEQVDNGP